jgi:hypothetical protein
MAGSDKLRNGRNHFAMRRDAVYSSHSVPVRLVWGVLRTAHGSTVTGNLSAVSTLSHHQGTPAFRRQSVSILQASLPQGSQI